MQPNDRRVRDRKRQPSIEGLEARSMLTATAVPDVSLVSATTIDSKSVTVTYDVSAQAAGQPIALQVVRSADPALEPGDVPVGSSQLVPPAAGQPPKLAGGTLDNFGQPATNAGHHTVTLPLPGGIPINPQHPYVVVSAQTAAEQAQGIAPSTAAFRKFVVGVITHGGKQPKSWSRLSPPWERRMANQLKADGYDAVIPYNWVAVSSHAGSAAQQGPRVASLVAQAATQFPANAPVDVHFIGHSEGAVVNSQAILYLNQNGWPQNEQAGYLKVTMLDPHAATSAVPGQQYSVSNGVLGYIARNSINSYQSRAKDPLPVVTSNVQDAEVFYQHTPVSQTFGSNSGIYNLWGQVPVRGKATYYDLTAPGVSHAGKFGVQDWYRLNVVPSLGNGGTFITQAAVTGSEVGTGTLTLAGRRERVSYAGTAAPNTTVRLWLAPPDQSAVTEVGRSKVNADGTWQLTTKPLVTGQYRVVATTTAPHASAGHRRVHLRPTAWLGTLVVNPQSTS